MASEAPQTLLTAEDPPPVRITNGGGASLFLLLGDHAGNLVPSRLGMLGLGPDDLGRHIALDIGVSELGRLLAMKLDATFVEQRYSRLVVDCNRSKDAAASIAEVSDHTTIPGNASSKPEWRAHRYAEIFDPYQRAIARVIEARSRQGRSTTVVSLHSFTPVLAGEKRPWDVGVLYDGGNTAFARRVLVELMIDGELLVGDNAPYHMDGTDFTIPQHCYARGLPYVELEIRQDRLGSPHGIDAMSQTFADTLLRSATVFTGFR